MAKKTKKNLSVPKVRTLKLPKYSSFSKRIKHPGPKLPGSFKILKGSLIVLKQNWKLFLGITVVYTALTLLLVRGFSGGVNVGQLKSSLTSSLQGNANQLSVGVTLFGTLIGSSNSGTTDVAGLYQTTLIILVSLASIWALRQVHAKSKTKVSIKNSFYKSTYSLTPFILVLLIVGLQLIPMLIGASIYATVMNNGLAVTVSEQFLWGALFFITALVSLYLITSSIFALYIVTLPDMTPMKALRSARQLVKHRRWTVLRKVLFLPFALLVIFSVIIVPLIIVLPAIAGWVYFILSMAVIVVIHSYMYSLYRELL
jgi:hypothetical protein